MNIINVERQSASVSGEAQITGETSCNDVTDMQEPVTKDSGTVVSPAISHATANGREKLITESNASKSCNQSGSNSVNMKPDCYKCKYRRELVGDAHSSCVNPNANPIALILFSAGQTEFKTANIHLRGNTHGIRSGWFMWPMNFDPTWLEICSGFEASNRTQL